MHTVPAEHVALPAALLQITCIVNRRVALPELSYQAVISTPVLYKTTLINPTSYVRKGNTVTQ